MSATNRSDARQNHLDDFYETPPWLSHVMIPHLLEYLEDAYEERKQPLKVLEPAAGAGAIHDAMALGLSSFSKTEWTLCDLNPRRSDVFESDWLGDYHEAEFDYDLIVTNPPYKLALEFCQLALERKTRSTF